MTPFNLGDIVIVVVNRYNYTVRGTVGEVIGFGPDVRIRPISGHIYNTINSTYVLDRSDLELATPFIRALYEV